MAAERRAIHAYVTEQAHDTWHDVAEEAGVSVSGFLEAIGADMKAHPPFEGGHPRWDELVRAARKVDAQRRRRTRS